MLTGHLHLRNLPERIECFNISDIGGQYSAGSMVTFVAGSPWKGDEAHRFAISYHRNLKEKGGFQSVLDEIPGIGGDRKRALLTFFGDMRKIRETPVEALQQIDGIGKHTAEKIHAFLQGHQYLPKS